MKTLFFAALLLALCARLGAQSWAEKNGLIWGAPEKPKTAAELALDKAKAQRAEAARVYAALTNRENYRVVAGKLYNAALAEKWVALPGEFYRGFFEQTTDDGPMFVLEKMMGGTALYPVIWWKFDRLIIVTNYPGPAKVAGDPMRKVLALPVSTSKQHPGVSVFDFGLATNVWVGPLLR